MTLPCIYPIDNDPSGILRDFINQAMGRIRQRGDVDDKTLEYLMVNNPKLGRFYLLPKIHKGLIVSLEGQLFRIRVSTQRIFRNFWIFIYNPWLKVSVPT